MRGDVTVAMQAFLEGGGTTLSWCWKLTLTNGTVLYFNDSDGTITFGGHDYLPTPGFKRTAIEFSEGLDANDIELVGLIDASNITRADIISGVYSMAKVLLFIVNRADTSMGSISELSGINGSLSRDRSRWTFQINGITKQLSQKFGEVTSPGCRATFGDTRCGFNLATVTNTGTVLTTSNNRTFTATLAHGAGYYRYGAVIWTAGANNGRKMEVRDWDGTTVTLQMSMASDIAPGDTFTISKGCNKQFADVTNGCASNSNQVNFQGEPSLPGVDEMTRNVAFIGYAS